jgi:hypothetical protein
MATEKAETDRVPLTLALSTIAYLEELVRQGTTVRSWRCKDIDRGRHPARHQGRTTSCKK